jgi:transposase
MVFTLSRCFWRLGRDGLGELQALLVARVDSRSIQRVHKTRNGSRRIYRRIAAHVVTADTAYDADHLRRAIGCQGSALRQPQQPVTHAQIYARRTSLWLTPSYGILLSKLKGFRRVTTRFEMTARNYRAVVARSYNVVM